MAKGEDGAKKPGGKLASAERDIMALGIAIAAIVLFVGTGGSVLPQVFRAWLGTGTAPDLLLTNALLLNIALLIFGWRRYRDLRAEVVERRGAERRAPELAEIDPLTGCLNRRSGPIAIDAMRAAASARGEEIAVLLLDIDNFKQVNDMNGHSVGDAVLLAIVGRVRELLGDAAVIVRIGGDEFACALPFAFSDRNRVDALAERLVERIAEPIRHGDLQIHASVSVGIAHSRLAPADGEPLTADRLIHRADIAMYHAKKHGRCRYYWFEAQMEDDLRFRSELESGIRAGLKAGEFVPYYEQQIDLESGELAGFEMLARWRSPRYGLVSPDIFIPVAEEMDVIGELSAMLVRQALNDAAEWDPRLTLAINISPVQLRDPWFAQKLLQLLVETGFPASRLELEITESCLHENIGAVRSIIVSLRNQGIRISLDDFGVGYASLSQLRTLPFDRLKIDRSFVMEIADEGNSTELVRAMVLLGKGLAMPVTAEGISDARVLAALEGLGELKGQGYHYGRPEDAAATRERLARLDLLAKPVAAPTIGTPAGELAATVREAG